MIYLDFAKAFDKVDYELKNIGVCGKLSEWIHNFLSNGIQWIKTGGVFPNLSKVTSSVPQGTILEPILFLVLINDINLNIDSKVSSFADDTRICGISTSIANALKIGQDLNCIHRWKNNIAFTENFNYWDIVQMKMIRSNHTSLQMVTK